MRNTFNKRFSPEMLVPQETLVNEYFPGNEVDSGRNDCERAGN